MGCKVLFPPVYGWNAEGGDASRKLLLTQLPTAGLAVGDTPGTVSPGAVGVGGSPLQPPPRSRKGRGCVKLWGRGRLLFPGAALAKKHRLGGSETQKLTVSHFWRPESKIKV